MRVMHGVPRRRARVRLPDRRGPGPGPRRAHGRGAGRRRRAVRHPAGVPGRRSRAVRVLHPGAAGRGARPDRAPRRPGGRGDPRGAGREPLPLHRLREDSGRRTARFRAPCGSGGPAVSTGGAGPEPVLTVTTPVGKGVGEGVGADAARPDGIPKVTGEFQYASDLWLDGMIWGVTPRSPPPYGRIRLL